MALCIGREENGPCDQKALPNEVFCARHLKLYEEKIKAAMTFRDRLAVRDRFVAMAKRPSEK